MDQKHEMQNVQANAAAKVRSDAKNKGRRRERDRNRAVDEAMGTLEKARARLYQLAKLTGREELGALVCLIGEGQIRLDVGGPEAYADIAVAASLLAEQRIAATLAEVRKPVPTDLPGHAA